jgi:nicotinate-nucleotide adenylyltransferase
MTDKILDELKDLYKKKPNRLRHVLGVRDTALTFGRKYGCDLEKLETAALLHDITKYYSNDDNVALIKEHFDNFEEILNNYTTPILHAYSARVIAENVYGIKDEDILNAITHHTVGKANMTIYEQIIFVSDYIEPNRTYKSSIKVRKIAEESLDLATYTAIDDTITHYEKIGGEIPKAAYKAREYYRSLLEE